MESEEIRNKEGPARCAGGGLSLFLISSLHIISHFFASFLA
jgi:hypothetical protein